LSPALQLSPPNANPSTGETATPKTLDLPVSTEAGDPVLSAAIQEVDGGAPGFQLARLHGYSNSFAETKVKDRK